MQSLVVPASLVKSGFACGGAAPGFGLGLGCSQRHISKLYAGTRVKCVKRPSAQSHPNVSLLTPPTHNAARQLGSARCFSSFLGVRQGQGRQLLGQDVTVSAKANVMLAPIARGAATKRKDIVQQDDSQRTSLTTGEKVKRAGKDATYTGIVVVGVGVTGFMFYAIGRELLSGESPNGVYSRAFKLCKKSEEVTDNLGTPLKGYGEMTRRGRRRHTNHTEFEVDGVKIMRMKFYVEGPLGKGTAQLEVRKNEGEKYEFRYLFVSMDDYPHKTIVVQDNR